MSKTNGIIAKNNLIENNIFTSTDKEPVLVVYRGGVADLAKNNTLKNNVIYNGTSGDWLSVSGGLPDSTFLDHNTMNNNQFDADGIDLTPPGR